MFDLRTEIVKGTIPPYGRLRVYTLNLSRQTTPVRISPITATTAVTRTDDKISWGESMTIHRTDSKILLLSTLLLLFSTALSGAPVDSRITAVTVYGDRAIVTRTASSDLTVGEHALVFENLPSALVDQSLQASGRGVAGATILDVTAQTVFVEATVIR
jgi:hypothetical protein